MTRKPKHTNSETLVIIGAGATAALGMPTTDKQTKILRDLSNASGDYSSTHKTLGEYFYKNDLDKVVRFLQVLDNDKTYEIRDSDLQNAKFIYGEQDDSLLRKRIHELRQQYDWNALKHVIKICPHNKNEDNLIRDVFSIIDKKLLSHQSLKELSVSRLQGARNFLILLINMLFSASWYKITNGEEADNFAKYQKFFYNFARLMQDEARRFYNKYPLDSREFYLFTTSFVSFNFEMVFPWLLMKTHYNLNHRKPCIKDRPLKLWLDYGCEHRGRKSNADGNIISTLEFTEAVASRENEDAHIGSELNRCGKFYFAHGSSNWRECSNCGRMTFYNGDSKSRWEDYKSKELISPFPIPLFKTKKLTTLTHNEQQWRKELQYDALECMHCGAQTLGFDAPMIMQTMYKSTPTSFLEEIQRNVKVAIEKARHIVLLGYSLPIDDTIWQHAFAEGIRAREEGDEAYCSVVVGIDGEERWLYKKEIAEYIQRNPNTANTKTIQNARAIFGADKVRAWTGGIPQVFGACGMDDVRELLYPDFVCWAGTRVNTNTT